MSIRGNLIQLVQKGATEPGRPLRVVSSPPMSQLQAALAFALLALLCPAAGASAAAECSAAPGLEALLEPGTVLLLGELHGTREAPAFVETVACRALARNLPVVVGLELPVAEAPRVAEYLASDGGERAGAALLAGPLWQAEHQYGVASRAVVGLLDALRARQAAGAAVEVVLYDPGGVSERDRKMAQNLAGVLGARPEAFAVVLSGNIHNRLTVGTPFDPELEPMGHLLMKRLEGRRVVSLDLAHQGGTAWLCFNSNAEECGPKKLSGEAGRTTGVELDGPGDGMPFSGRYFTGPITASPPAAAGEGAG